MKNLLVLILLLTLCNVYGQEDSLIGKYIKISEDSYYKQGFDNFYIDIDTSLTKLKFSNRWSIQHNGRTSFDKAKGQTGKIVDHIRYGKKEAFVISDLDSLLIYYSYKKTNKLEFSFVEKVENQSLEDNDSSLVNSNPLVKGNVSDSNTVSQNKFYGLYYIRILSSNNRDKSKSNIPGKLYVSENGVTLKSEVIVNSLIRTDLMKQFSQIDQGKFYGKVTNGFGKTVSTFIREDKSSGALSIEISKSNIVTTTFIIEKFVNQ